ncbi:MAG: 2-oxoacid:acceptor oxidoreductase family protein [Planctomycetes bacterium]|nr:2-oxoacid:acceptor oxidoreductase family protein [Planctomycetota bacterium]
MMTEIRWHARGGQGALLAVRTLARVAINHGKFAQGMPEFGAERMGAPTRAFNRISDKPLSLYCGITNPDVIIVLDTTLLDAVNVTEGIRKGGTVLINTNRSADEIKQKVNKQIGGNADARIYAVDATGISIKELGRPMPNTPILGALVKITGGAIKMDDLLSDIKHSFSEKFPPKVVDANLNAIKQGYEQVRPV